MLSRLKVTSFFLILSKSSTLLVTFSFKNCFFVMVKQKHWPHRNISCLTNCFHVLVLKLKSIFQAIKSIATKVMVRLDFFQILEIYCTQLLIVLGVQFCIEFPQRECVFCLSCTKILVLVLCCTLIYGIPIGRRRKDSKQHCERQNLS